MKINIKVITFALVTVLAVLYSPTVASAAEGATYEYYLYLEHQESSGNFRNNPQYWNYESITVSCPLYAYIAPSTLSTHVSGTQMIYFIALDANVADMRTIYPLSLKGELRRTHATNGEAIVALTKNDFYAQCGSLSLLNAYLSEGRLPFSRPCYAYNTNIPVFSSSTALLAYLENGDDSGLLNKPQVDYSIKHDFTSDVYTTDIPVPEISNITYNGFVVDNIGDYYIDVLVDSKFCGVKHVERLNGVTMNSKTWDIAPDNVWVYNKHYYNLSSDVFDCAYSDSHINISEMYGVDIVADFVSDFVTWSKEYPTVKDLPDYSWLKMGLASTSYPNKHIYEADSEMTDYMQIMESGQAVVTYYVRFYDSNGRNGRWASYTYQSGYDTIDNSMVGLGTLSSGVIDVNTNGDIYIKDSAVGQVDDSGSITYGSTIDTVDIDSGIEGFMNVMLLFEDAIGSVSGFVASIFGFLPWWATSILGLGLTAVVILRFAGR